MSDEERFAQIESRLAHQDMQIQELSDLAQKQWDEIEILKARLRRAHEQLEEVRETAGESGGESLTATEMAARDKPPHY